MRNSKKGNGLVILILVGLLAVAAIGAVMLTQGGDKASAKPVKPTVEASR